MGCAGSKDEDEEVCTEIAKQEVASNPLKGRKGGSGARRASGNEVSTQEEDRAANDSLLTSPDLRVAAWITSVEANREQFTIYPPVSTQVALSGSHNALPSLLSPVPEGPPGEGPATSTMNTFASNRAEPRESDISHSMEEG